MVAAVSFASIDHSGTSATDDSSERTPATARVTGCGGGGRSLSWVYSSTDHRQWSGLGNRLYTGVPALRITGGPTVAEVRSAPWRLSLEAW